MAEVIETDCWESIGVRVRCLWDEGTVTNAFRDPQGRVAVYVMRLDVPVPEGQWVTGRVEEFEILDQ